MDKAAWASKRANEIAVPMPENWPSTPFGEYPAQPRSDGPEILEEYGPPLAIMWKLARLVSVEGSGRLGRG